jgi:hypothetical protein
VNQESTVRRVSLVALVLATVVALAWVLWPHPTREAAAPSTPLAVVPGTLLKASVCGTPPAKPFVPTRISIKKVATDAPVIALGRDSNNVPQAPAVSSVGKSQFAWDDPTLTPSSMRNPDRLPGAVPGSPQGNVLINTHTWPDGTAFGNHLLDHLQVGGRIILRGKHAELCYKVTRRFVIKAIDGSVDYYVQDGPPQLALIVCSPPRLGPGNWENRTIWLASPITPADPAT